MNMQNELRHTPGRLLALWRTLILVHEYENEFLSVQDVVGAVRESAILGGSVPAKDGIALGQRYGLLEIKSGQLRLTEYCKNIVLTLCEDSEPSPKVLRELLDRIIRRNRYHWLLFFSEDVDTSKLEFRKTGSISWKQRTFSRLRMRP